MRKRQPTPEEIRAFRALARAANRLREVQEDAERHRQQRDDSTEDRNGQDAQAVHRD